MRQDSNTKQALWVGLGSLASFCFVLGSSMILSRFLDKEQYGSFRQVLYVYNSMLVVFTLGLPRAYNYFLPRLNKEEGKDFIGKMTIMFSVLGSILSLILYFASGIISQILNNPELDLLLKIFSPVPMLLLPTLGLESIYATYRKTHVIALYTVFSNLIKLMCVALPVIFLAQNAQTCILGFVLASLLTAMIALYLNFKPFKGYKREKTAYSYRAILKYSIPLMFASIFGLIAHSADQFFISRYFGAEVFAVFSNGSLELPLVGMVVGAGTTVIAPLFSKMVHNNNSPKSEILPLWTSTFSKTVLIVYPVLIFTFCFAKEIMTALYGDAYETSSIYFQIKTIINFFNLIMFAPLLLALGKQNLYAKGQLILALLVVSLEYLSIKTINSPYAIPIISSASRIVLVLVFLKVIANYFDLKIMDLFPIKTVIKTSLLSISSALPTLFILNQFPVLSPLGNLLLGFMLFSILFAAGAYFLKLDYFKLITPLFRR